MTVTINGTTGIVGPDGSASTPAIQGADSNTGMFFPAADTVAIATGGTERMRTDSSGNVGVGVTPSAWSSTYRAVQVGETGSQAFTANSNYLVNNAYYSATGWKFLVSAYTQVYEQNRATGTHIWYTSNSGTAGGTPSFTQVMTLDASGNLRVQAIYNLTTGGAANVHVSADGTLYRSTSSLKYKTDVQDATHGIAEVMALRPVTYKGVNDGETVFGGLIAEEVHAAGLTEFVQYAEDGTPDALAYGNMVALAFKAIQEQQALITSLTARIAALEGAAQ